MLSVFIVFASFLHSLEKKQSIISWLNVERDWETNMADRLLFCGGGGGGGGGSGGADVDYPRNRILSDSIKFLP